MSEAKNIHSRKCIKCGVSQATMDKIGPMTFCNNCFEVEFIDTGNYYEETDEIETDCENYQNWLKFYEKHIAKI